MKGFVGALLILAVAHRLPAQADAGGKLGGNEPIRPITPLAGLDARKVALGRALFHEPRLSRDSTISCASCHDLG